MKKEITFEEKIIQIQETILSYVPAKYIYLFGSYAYGAPTENSDIDVCAVIPDDFVETLTLHGDIIWELLDKSIYDIDLIIKTESNFDFRKNRHRFEETIYKQGRLLYENR